MMDVLAFHVATYDWVALGEALERDIVTELSSGGLPAELAQHELGCFGLYGEKSPEQVGSRLFQRGAGSLRRAARPLADPVLHARRLLAAHRRRRVSVGHGTDAHACWGESKAVTHGSGYPDSCHNPPLCVGHVSEPKLQMESLRLRGIHRSSIRHNRFGFLILFGPDQGADVHLPSSGTDGA